MPERTQRRLAAIVSADVVGYSKLMGADEAGTLERLRQLRREVIDPEVAAHGGRIVKTMGDGLLLEFASVVEATKCGLEIQERLADRNAELPEQERMVFRIGINLGDIIIDGDDILGDGVNLAARLQEMAEPGGIAISRRVHEDAEDRLDASFADLGAHTLKNIQRPVHVFAWQPGGPATSPTSRHVGPAADEPPAVAVLPFDNLSGDPEQEYFSDGLTEDLITALSLWRSFPVIARNTTFAYKGQHVDAKQLAGELNAGYVLEGSVRKAGNRVRITAQLIDGSNGHHVWAERYDRELDDIFQVQDDIVQRIVALIAPELAKAELKRSAKKREEDLDAWDLFLRAMPLLRERTQEGNEKARALFLRAIAIRPEYSDAYSGLAETYNMEARMAAIGERKEAAFKAMAAAQQAVKHDAASSWAHHELSTAYQWLERFDDALDEARIAVERNPNDAYAVHALGNKSDLAGDPDGIAYMEQAQRLDPENAQNLAQLTYLARAYLNAEEYDTAVDRARKALRQRPDFAPAYFVLALALGQLGEMDEARAAFARCKELSPEMVESRRNWQPYADPSRNEKLQAAFRLIEG